MVAYVSTMKIKTPGKIVIFVIPTALILVTYWFSFPRTPINQNPNKIWQSGCYMRKGWYEYFLHDIDLLDQLGCRKRLPNAMIIGAKKGGTSALKLFLDVHPDVAMAKHEVHFSDDNIFPFGPEYYRKQMLFSTSTQITIEKRVCFAAHENVLRGIHELLPELKIILVLSNPVYRAISDYLQMKLEEYPQMGRQTGIWSRSWEKETYYEVLDTFEESAFYKNGSIKANNWIIAKGIYSRYLKLWTKYFSLSQILILDSEELLAKPINALHKVEQFLSIRPYFNVNSLYFDKKKGFHCLKLPFRNCLPKNKGRAHPKVSKRTFDKLTAFYKKYNKDLLLYTKYPFAWMTAN